MQMKLPGVPLAKQGREVPPQWEWTEAAVWTERMLATLERGITGGKWYRLDDKVWKMENLQRAVEKVRAGKSPKKPDGRKCRRYAEQSAQRLPHSMANIFPDLDGWVRGRLRTIHRKRHKGKGRARGTDHQKWPNAYFAGLGLISLALTREQAANAHNEPH